MCRVIMLKMKIGMDSKKELVKDDMDKNISVCLSAASNST